MSLAHKFINKIETSYPLYLITILILIPLIIYFPSLFNSFVWDDEEQVLNNTIIQNIKNIPYLFTSSTFNTGGAGLSGFYYKPLMPVVFSLNYFVWKNNPFGFHLFDLILHITNGILIYILFKRLFSLQKFRYAKTASFFLSSIFLIHPVNTESVVYISSTQELLYTFFLLLSLISSVLSVQNPIRPWSKLVLINLFILLSLLSKESGVVAIPLIITFTYLFNRIKIKIMIISLVMTFLFYLFLRFGIAKTSLFQHNSIIPIANASFLERLTTIPFELFSYLRLIFFPKDLFVAQHMVINNISDHRFYISFIIVILFLILIISPLKKMSFNLRHPELVSGSTKLYLFFLLWLVFSFLLLLNIYPLDMTIAERWLYSPLIGVLGLLGVLISMVSPRRWTTALLRGGIFVLILLISLFSFRTFIRATDWKDNLSLFSRDEKYASDSFDLQNNLGVALFKNGSLKESKKHFEKSIQLSPKWWTSYNNLGVIYQREGDLKKAKQLYELSIKNGSYYLAYENLANIKYNTEKPETVLPFIKKSLFLLPNNETLNKIAALVYYKTGATESAKMHARRAFLINKSQENYLLMQEITDNN